MVQAIDFIINPLINPHKMILLPIRNSLLEILHLVGDNFKSLAKFISIAAFAFALVSSLGYFQLAVRCLTWVLLGVASSIGFGFGMHTFVLFLAPHIASITIAAHTCNSLDFPEPPYPDELICPSGTDYQGQITFLNILQKVALESFMWGLGTALGELPPYLAARLRSIGRRIDGDSLATDQGVAGWEQWMIKIINKVGFFGILLCAAIPNPLFDAAGVASGIAQVPFLSFFGATFIGKAIIKVLIQASFVILSFHNKNLDSFVYQLDKKLSEIFPSTRDLKLNQSISRFLELQRNNVLKKQSGESAQVSWFSSVFNWIIFACFALFIMSVINALDKQYRDRTDRESKYSKKKD